MIVSVVGDVKNGKTMWLTALGVGEINDGNSLVVNYDVDLPSRRISTLEVREDSEFEFCTVLLDEANKDFDCRESGSKWIRDVSRFISDVGKRRVKVYYSTHFPKRVDKRLREHTNFQYTLRKNSYYDESSDDECIYGFYVDMKNMYDGVEIKRYYPIDIMLPFLSLYDSYDWRGNMSRHISPAPLVRAKPASGG